MKPRNLLLPLDSDAVKMLHAGDEVELTGAVLTGRDQSCERIFNILEERKRLPVAIAGQLMYFVGPSPPRPGSVIGSAGPTTSGRMNPFLPTFLRHGLIGFIGKGYIAQEVKEALVKHSALYFGAVGGTGALLSECIVSAEIIAFPELLSEAVYRMQFNRFPVVVLNDAFGGDLYSQALKDYL